MKEATSVSKKRSIDQVIEKDDTAKEGEVKIKEEKVDSADNSTNVASENVEVDSEVC